MFTAQLCIDAGLGAVICILGQLFFADFKDGAMGACESMFFPVRVVWFDVAAVFSYFLWSSFVC